MSIKTKIKNGSPHCGPFLLQNAFTLLELVIMIVLLGILAITALPKMFEAAPIELNSVHSQLLSSMRLSQLYAMQNTQADSCARTFVIEQHRFGKLNNCPNPLPNNYSASLDGSLYNINGNAINGIGKDLSQYPDVEMGAAILEFNSQGIAQACAAAACTLTVSGYGDTLCIRVEKQGFIHASSCS